MQHYFCDPKRVGLKCVGESVTVPDDSYTIKELILRFNSGCMPAIGRNVIYDDDPDFECIDPTCSPDFDLVDHSELTARLSSDIARLSKALQPSPKEDEVKEDVSKE